MSSLKEDLYSIPSYYSCVVDIYTSIITLLKQSNESYSYPMDFVKDIRVHTEITRFELLLVVCLAVTWTLLRYVTTVLLFLPFAERYKLQPLAVRKFPESAWKLIFYSCTWGASIYVLLFNHYDYFYEPLKIWTEWHSRMVVSTDIYIVYMVQFSFYMHSVYATLYMDRWRKDSIVMLFHHFLTMVLIGFSYAARFHKIGLLVLFLHDVTDICLEFTKCNVYMKRQGRKNVQIHESLSTVGFLGFAGTWFIFRLYWFPLKVLHAASLGVLKYAPQHHIPFWFFFNIMLWILTVLNIYWFCFILNFLYKVATGQIKEVDDIREHEVDEKLEIEKKVQTLVYEVNGGGDLDLRRTPGQHVKAE